MATHSSILAWRIPWTEEADRLQSMGLQSTGHDLATEHRWSQLVSARFWFSWHISPWKIPAWALFQVGKPVNFASVISGPPILDNAAVSWLLTVVWSLSPTLCDPMDCRLPGSSVHGILQARMLEWVAISFSRGSSWSKVQTCISYIGRRMLYHWETREAWLLLVLSSSSYRSSSSKAEQVPSPWFMWGIAGAFSGASAWLVAFCLGPLLVWDVQLFQRETHRVGEIHSICHLCCIAPPGRERYRLSRMIQLSPWQAVRDGGAYAEWLYCPLFILYHQRTSAKTHIPEHFEPFHKEEYLRCRPMHSLCLRWEVGKNLNRWMINWSNNEWSWWSHTGMHVHNRGAFGSEGEEGRDLWWVYKKEKRSRKAEGKLGRTLQVFSPF